MTTVSALKPAWAGRAMRLDPAHLPRAMQFSGRDEFGEAQFTLDGRGATIRRVLKGSGLPATIALPAQAFAGVAARAIEDDFGNVTVTLELHHADPMLSIPLLVADDLEDVAADWRAWSDFYNLPMLLIEGDGVARTLEESLRAASRAAQAAFSRRQGSSTHARRPRFLARRKVGGLGLHLVVEGEEIIAAN